jgi:phage terminase large subunit
MRTLRLELPSANWSKPLEAPKRYKGAKGGRSSGKSHFFAEKAVQEMVESPNLRFLCLRETQRSLDHSAKALIEGKIQTMGVSHLFRVMKREIRRLEGNGLMIFEGMQDHTADSIKSFEDFGRAWFEEAHRLSARSLSLLDPTIRRDGSEIWFSWNPEEETAPVEGFFREMAGETYPTAPGFSVGAAYSLVHVNFTNNPFCPQTAKDTAARLYRVDPDAYDHVWLGAYNTKSAAQVLRGKWIVDEFTPGEDWDGPYHGADFGFAEDPTVLTRCWIHAGRLYVEREAWGVGIETNHILRHWQNAVEDVDGYVVRADSARPETISYLRNHGMPKIVGVDKWPGSIEDGIEHLRQYERIIVHPRCEHTQEQFKLYSHKVDRLTGDVMRDIVDKHNEYPDALRYALAPLIKQRRRAQRLGLPGTTSHSNV